MEQQDGIRLEQFRQLKKEVGNVSFFVSGKRNGVHYAVNSNPTN